MRFTLCLVGFTVYTQIVGKAIPQVRGLVVGGVLPHDAHAINMVLHEAGYFVLRGLGGGIDKQCACLGIAIVIVLEKDEFLAPIAQDVGLQTGGSLGAVAGFGGAVAYERLEHGDIVGLGIVIAYTGIVTTMRGGITAVEGLIVGVAGPINAIVEVGSGLEQGVTVSTIAYHSVLCRPELGTAVRRDEVAGQSTSVVFVPGSGTEHFAGGGIVNVVAVGTRLVGHHHFQSGTIGTEVGEVYGIAMPHAGGAKQGTVVGYGGGTGDDFIESIAVYIGYGYGVVAL
jgi:hypothetical protein